MLSRRGDRRRAEPGAWDGWCRGCTKGRLKPATTSTYGNRPLAYAVAGFSRPRDLPPRSQQEAERPAVVTAVERAGAGDLDDQAADVGAGAGADTAELVALERGAAVARPQQAGVHERDCFDRHASVLHVAAQ